jgi:type II secretory pathway pseudopilin PulG
MKNLFLSKGVSIVEVLFGVSLFALITIFTTQTIALFLDNADRAQEEMHAVYLAEEGLEVVRYLRDDDWNTLADLTVDTPYYLAITASTLATTTVPETIGGTYSRSFVLREVYRDSDDDIVASTTAGAVVDTESKMVRMQVTWGSESVSLQTILTNIFDI